MRTIPGTFAIAVKENLDSFRGTHIGSAESCYFDSAYFVKMARELSEPSSTSPSRRRRREAAMLTPTTDERLAELEEPARRTSSARTAGRSAARLDAYLEAAARR
ncbi:MAG TPA: hypothetical protein VNB06_11695 [Thermoanaerobaculia bacterium]|nr:hypothetical protein [Thermoanaerobaculia bacterium]